MTFAATAGAARLLDSTKYILAATRPRRHSTACGHSATATARSYVHVHAQQATCKAVHRLATWPSELRHGAPPCTTAFGREYSGHDSTHTTEFRCSAGGGGGGGGSTVYTTPARAHTRGARAHDCHAQEIARGCGAPTPPHTRNSQVPQAGPTDRLACWKHVWACLACPFRAIDARDAETRAVWCRQTQAPLSWWAGRAT